MWIFHYLQEYRHQYLKIMRLVSLKLEGDISKETEPNISPKFFYTHEFQQSRQIDVKQKLSTDNLAYLFTKTLSTSTFEKLVYEIGMRRFCKLQDWYWSFIQGERSIRGSKIFEWIYVYCTLFPSTGFCPTGFYRKDFNEAVLNTSMLLDPEDHCIYFC